MLDQNADRFYWVIGAVIIVAILIGAAKIAFPDIFNDVINYFTTQLTGTTGFIAPFK